MQTDRNLIFVLILLSLATLMSCQPAETLPPEPTATETSPPAPTATITLTRPPTSTVGASITSGEAEETPEALADGEGAEDAVEPVQSTAPAEILLPTLANCPLPDGWVTYTVETGDTYFDLGRAVALSVDELLEANCTENSVLRLGQTLYLPQPPEGEENN